MSENFPDKVIETPFGRITQGDFLDRTDWSLQDKIFVKEIWKKLPQISLREMLKIKSQMARGQASGRAAAKLFLEKHAKAYSTQKRERAETPLSPSAALGKTATHPQMKRARKKQVLAQKPQFDSIGKTGSFPQIRPRKQTARYPVFAQIGEGKFFSQAKCKSCDNIIKIPMEKAGRMHRCNTCQKEFKVSDGYFYLKKDPDADVQGPFLISRYRELIERKGLTPQVYVSGDQEKWKKVEDGDQSLLLLIAKYALSTQEREAAISKISVSHLLARCAVEVQDREIQEIAIEKIDDRQLMGKVVGHLNDTKLVALALDKIDDQNIIAEFVKNTAKQELIADAMEKVSDQRILAGLACDIDEHVRWHAIRKLTDQIVLQKVALSEKTKPLRLFAVGKLSDGKTLLHVALNDREADVQLAAIEKISDQQDLLRIAKEAENSRVRMAATNKIDDREILMRIVEESKDREVQKVALGNISDQKSLERVVMEGDLQVQTAALKMITDLRILVQIAENSKHDEIVNSALANLPQPTVTSLVLEEKTDEKLRKTAMQKVVDRESLAKIYRESRDDNVRWIAVHRMTDQNLLAEIAVKGENISMSRLAESKIIDPVLTVRVAANSKHSEVRQEATRKTMEFLEQTGDREIIEQILINTKDRDLQQAAISKISDQGILTRVALKAVDENARMLAAQSIKELEALEQISGKADPKVYELVMEKIAKLRPAQPYEEAIGGIVIDSEDVSGAGIIIDSQDIETGIVINGQDVVDAVGTESTEEEVSGIVIAEEGIEISAEDSDLKDDAKRFAFVSEEAASQRFAFVETGRRLPDAPGAEAAWAALQKLAGQSSKSIMKYFSPVVLKKLAQTAQSGYDSNILWTALQKIAAENTALLCEYLSPAAICILIEDSLSEECSYL